MGQNQEPTKARMLSAKIGDLLNRHQQKRRSFVQAMRHDHRFQLEKQKKNRPQPVEDDKSFVQGTDAGVGVPCQTFDMNDFFATLEEVFDIAKSDEGDDDDDDEDEFYDAQGHVEHDDDQNADETVLSDTTDGGTTADGSQLPPTQMTHGDDNSTVEFDPNNPENTKKTSRRRSKKTKTISRLVHALRLAILPIWQAPRDAGDTSGAEGDSVVSGNTHGHQTVESSTSRNDLVESVSPHQQQNHDDPNSSFASDATDDSMASLTSISTLELTAQQSLPSSLSSSRRRPDPPSSPARRRGRVGRLNAFLNRRREPTPVAPETDTESETARPFVFANAAQLQQHLLKYAVENSCFNDLVENLFRDHKGQWSTCDSTASDQVDSLCASLATPSPTTDHGSTRTASFPFAPMNQSCGTKPTPAVSATASARMDMVEEDEDDEDEQQSTRSLPSLMSGVFSGAAPFSSKDIPSCPYTIDPVYITSLPGQLMSGLFPTESDPNDPLFGQPNSGADLPDSNTTHTKDSQPPDNELVCLGCGDGALNNSHEHGTATTGDAANTRLNQVESVSDLGSTAVVAVMESFSWLHLRKDSVDLCATTNTTLTSHGRTEQEIKSISIVNVDGPVPAPRSTNLLSVLSSRKHDVLGEMQDQMTDSGTEKDYHAENSNSVCPVVTPLKSTLSAGATDTPVGPVCQEDIPSIPLVNLLGTGAHLVPQVRGMCLDCGVGPLDFSTDRSTTTIGTTPQAEANQLNVIPGQGASTLTTGLESIPFLDYTDENLEAGTPFKVREHWENETDVIHEGNKTSGLVPAPFALDCQEDDRDEQSNQVQLQLLPSFDSLGNITELVSMPEEREASSNSATDLTNLTDAVLTARNTPTKDGPPEVQQSHLTPTFQVQCEHEESAGSPMHSNSFIEKDEWQDFGESTPFDWQNFGGPSPFRETRDASEPRKSFDSQSRTYGWFREENTRCNPRTGQPLSKPKLRFDDRDDEEFKSDYFSWTTFKDPTWAKTEANSSPRTVLPIVDDHEILGEWNTVDLW